VTCALPSPKRSLAAFSVPVRASAYCVVVVKYVVSALNQIFAASSTPMPVTVEPSQVGLS
jgi:hypothetical protein